VVQLGGVFVLLHVGLCWQHAAAAREALDAFLDPNSMNLPHNQHTYWLAVPTRPLHLQYTLDTAELA